MMLPPPPLKYNPEEARQYRVLHFHDQNNALQQQPFLNVTWRDRPKQFLHYPSNPQRSLDRPPLTTLQDSLLPDAARDRPREVLYSEVFSFCRSTIPATPLDKSTLSQFLLDALGVSDDDDFASAEKDTVEPVNCVNPSAGGGHPTEVHVISPAVPDFITGPFVAHYSPARHSLQFRASVPQQFFDRYLPTGALLVGISTIFWREAWWRKTLAFRLCHLDAGHAVAAVAFAAAALGWDARVLDGLSHRDLERLTGLKPCRLTRKRARDDDDDGKVSDKTPPADLQEPVCVVLVFPNAKDTLVMDYEILSRGIAEFFAPIRFLHGPKSISEGAKVLHREIYRVSEDVERKEPSKNLLIIRPARCWGSKSYPGFPGYENFTVREVVRSRRSPRYFKNDYYMDVEVFYQFLHHCLPSGYCGGNTGQKKQRVFPFMVLPWDSKIDVFVAVYRVQEFDGGLYCLVRNVDHLDALKQATVPDFAWHQCKEWSDMGLPLYRLLSGDLEDAVEELGYEENIAADEMENVALDFCFTMMMVASFDDLKQMKMYMYPRLFWESGVLGQLLSLDAQALGLSARGFGSFLTNEANKFLKFKGNFQTLYLYSVGKPEAKS